MPRRVCGRRTSTSSGISRARPYVRRSPYNPRVLPLADHNPRRVAPVVNILLIGANVLMFFWEVSLGSRLANALFGVAFIPVRFWYSPLHPLNGLSVFVS